MKAIELVFFDAGGGHRSAVNALLEIVAQQQRPWKLRPLNLQEVLDRLDIFRKLTGIRLQDIYNLLLKKGWTLGTAQLMRIMHIIIKLYHPAQVQLLERVWNQTQPNLVVSLVPNFNRALAESLRRARPETRFVTILTDIADCPPHVWIERQEQYLICGSERAVEQARALGHAPSKIFRTSGMILHPRFYDPLEIDRGEERRRLALDPHRPTALILFGGQGSNAMLWIAERIDRSELDVQLIFICGHNQKLADALRRRRYRVPVFVEGFTKQIPYYMKLADFFIGKPGPGSISEALAMNLPVIVERNAWTLPQERYNTQWIVENQLGLVIHDFKRIEQAVAELLRPENYDRLRSNAAAQQNRAVFEIPDILEKIMKG